MVGPPVLFRKLYRDLWRTKAQNFAVGFTVMLGVAFFGAATMSYRNLDASYRYSYDRLLFEDFGIALHSAPERAASRLLTIPGVVAVQGRLAQDVPMELPGRQDRRLVGRLISIPPDKRPLVDDLSVTEGRYLKVGSAREVLLESSFAKYHGLHPGDKMAVTKGTARVNFTIAGIVKSPEYIYVVRSKQDLFPLPDVYGVMYVSESVLGPLVGKTGMINEIKVRIDRPERLGTAMHEAASMLRVYRPDPPVPRADLPSHQLLQQDIEGFKAYSVLFPALFLSVAGLTFYTLLMRMITQQRAMIGLMRALGFTRGQVVRHYMASGFAVGVLSSAVGTGLGWAFAQWATAAYVGYGMIAIPFIRYEAAMGPMTLGFILGALVCTVASAAPARSAAAIGPAEALRGPKPASGRTIRIDRLMPGLKLMWRVPIRNVFRQLKRTLATLFGIVAGLALVIVAQGLLDSTSAMIKLMLTEMFRDDLRVAFAVPADITEVTRVRSWPGVVWAEGQLDVPIDFSKGRARYSALLSGVPDGTRFRQLQDAGGRPIELTAKGAIFGPTLRRRLSLEIGDTVVMRLPKEATDLEATPKLIQVAGFNEEPVGTLAYLPAREVWRIFHQELRWQPQAVTGIAVQVRERDRPEVRRRLLNLPAATAVTSIADLRTMVNALVELTRSYVFVMLAFGASLAFAIVYSMVSVNVVERTAEVATLRTLGFTRLEIAGMVTLENLILAALGVVFGLPAGKQLTEGFLIFGQSEEQMDLFKMTATIEPGTYIFSAILIVGVVLFAQMPALLGLWRIDLARAAKEQAA